MEHDLPNIDVNDRHPLVSFVSACFWVIMWLLSWVKVLVAFATITIPRTIYAILSYSLTLTLNFWSFALIFVLFAVALNYWIRFKYLDTYTQLKEQPLGKPDTQGLHPDVNTPEPPPAFHNYLDDFLQAIRVFGFLEKPVFHELARHLQTRRLIAGDTLYLDQDKSFYCVVDGLVQVYAHTGRNDVNMGANKWDNEDMNGYQLLNEVRSGGTLSSLFTILSLFTEDVQMSWPEGASEGSSLDTQENKLLFGKLNADVSHLNLDSVSSPRPRILRRSSSSASTVHGVDSPIQNSDAYLEPPTPGSARPSSYSQRPKDSLPQVHRGDVARALEDTTLAVIPAEAFRRLTKKFPKATGHIIQVILTRFTRVTFHAAHQYLGLTTEVLRTEKAINELACHPLPTSFYEGGGLQHLRQRFDGFPLDRPEKEEDYFNQSPPRTTSPVTKSLRTAVLSKEALVNSPVSSHPPSLRQHHSRRHQVQAGDLHSTAGSQGDLMRGPLTRSFSILNSPRMTRSMSGDSDQDLAHGTSGDEFNLRDEVMSCIAKSIGLQQPPLSGVETPDASPAILPLDSPRSRISKQFSASSFGSLSLLDIGDDTSSMTGGTNSVLSGHGDAANGFDNEVEILFYSAGSVLAKAGERNKGLFYVIEGFLDVLLPIPEEQKHPSSTYSHHGDESPASSSVSLGNDANPPPRSESSKKLLFTVKPGGIAGYLASLCNTMSYVDITAKTDTYVGFLPSHALERLLERQPIVLLTLAKRLISLLSPLVLHIDASLDWHHVNAGQVLWRPQEASDSFYIVINGRLRAISDKPDGGVIIVEEYGQGDTVGELDVITSSPRRNTLHAIRDTELIRMPQTLFNAISARNPQATTELLRMIASRVREETDRASNPNPPNMSSDMSRNNTNLKTIAILPVTRNVPVDAFAKKLHAALLSIGSSTSYLNQASVSAHLGRHAFSRMGKLKAAGWLADQEQRFNTVLYVADSPVSSSWTQTCIRQADCILIVGMGDDPAIGEYERLLLSMKTTARKELVLLHPDRTITPGSTREWLRSRPWVHRHIHVELPGLAVVTKTIPTPNPDPGAVAALKQLKDRVQSGLQKYRGANNSGRLEHGPNVNDFARLARRLCNRSIGIVLGGGGARGISHLGLIKALEEYDIPIDHIGGTSIGAFIGGLYAREGDIISSVGRAKQFSSRMGNIWRILSDVTYPLVAYTTGHEFNRAIYKAFYDLHIEDMWIPYFCNTTNINTSRMDIHETGYAWRFIRASMTLVGLLPPLCDNGHMHVDGGYTDNLPVSAMFSMGASAVIACDVGSIDDNSPRNFGDHVSGWWLLLNRWNPFSSAKGVPDIPEIQSRLAYVSSVRTLEEAKVARGCLYLQMPVQEYGTLQFSKFEEIHDRGYEAALKALEEWDKDGKLPFGHTEKDSAESLKKGRSARRNSI